jgi:hypothetical protein
VRPARAIVALTALLASALLPGAAVATPYPDVTSTTHTAGRVTPRDGGLAFSWPGVYLEGRFRGTGVGIVLDDAAADYDVAIDGRTVATLVTPGATTHWVDGLTDAVHTVRLVKRSESPWSTSTFGGFVAAPGGQVLAAPDARDLQIEYVGDSFTAGYGNESTTRECTGDQVNRATNADLSFGALTARALDADYQINAFSGRGMVRNYGGGEPGTSYRTYYDRALLATAGDVWDRPADWDPEVVVIGLGINDFSTPVGPGETWTAESLRTAYRTAYDGFLDTLRTEYGPDTYLVVSATPAGGSAQAELTEQIVRERNARGDTRVLRWFYGSQGLDLGGCHWHPSLADHRVIAGELTTFLEALPLGDGPTPTPTPTPTVSPTATPTTAPGGCTATLTLGSSWPGGYQASVQVTAGPVAITRWRTTFALPVGGAVASSWSGDVTTSGSTVTVTNASWNGALGAGASTAFGFIGTGPAPAASPATPVTCTTS